MQEGGTLTQARTSLLGAVDQLKAQGWQVAPDGTVSVRPGSMLDAYAKMSPANAMKLEQLAATNSVGLKTQLANFDTADRSREVSSDSVLNSLRQHGWQIDPDFHSHATTFKRDNVDVSVWVIPPPEPDQPPVAHVMIDVLG